jgi:protein gp37
MSDRTKIEWCSATWNPVRGCTKVSPGCKHCYAETFAERFRGVKGHPYEQGFDLRLVPEKIAEPFRWPTSKFVFVNSMSDLFQPGVPNSYVETVSRIMVTANWHLYQVLTKRSERMAAMLRGRLRVASLEPNIWWGVSVEDKKHGLPRIEHLRSAPAGLRFLSVEPLLEDLGEIDLAGIGWVIVGGESGPGARPMSKDWVLSLRDQCLKQGIPFFFKQWGGVRKGKHGRLLDGRAWDQYPAATLRPIPDRRDRAALAQSLAREGKDRFEESFTGSPLVALAG